MIFRLRNKDIDIAIRAKITKLHSIFKPVFHFNISQRFEYIAYGVSKRITFKLLLILFISIISRFTINPALRMSHYSSLAFSLIHNLCFVLHLLLFVKHSFLLNLEYPLKLCLVNIYLFSPI